LTQAHEGFGVLSRLPLQCLDVGELPLQGWPLAKMRYRQQVPVRLAELHGQQEPALWVGQPGTQQLRNLRPHRLELCDRDRSASHPVEFARESMLAMISSVPPQGARCGTLLREAVEVELVAVRVAEIARVEAGQQAGAGRPLVRRAEFERLAVQGLDLGR